MQTKTAVIVLNYFGINDTKECISSVRKWFPDNMIYIVDNSGETYERCIVEDSFKNSTDVEVFYPLENLGFAAGVNLAIRNAVVDGFTRFLVLNNDAILLKNAGLIFNRAIEEHPCSLIAPTILWENEICRGKYYHKYLGLISDKPLWQSKNFLFYLTGCAIYFDKAAFDKIGYFDDSFFMYGEDAEFSNRAFSKEVPLVLLNETLVKHYGSRSSVRVSFFYEYHINRAHFVISFRLSTSHSHLFISLLGKTLIMGTRAVMRSIRHLTFSPFLAFLIAPFPIRVRPRRKM